MSPLRKLDELQFEIGDVCITPSLLDRPEMHAFIIHNARQNMVRLFVRSSCSHLATATSFEIPHEEVVGGGYLHGLGEPGVTLDGYSEKFNSVPKQFVAFSLKNLFPSCAKNIQTFPGIDGGSLADKDATSMRSGMISIAPSVLKLLKESFRPKPQSSDSSFRCEISVVAFSKNSSKLTVTCFFVFTLRTATALSATSRSPRTRR